MKKLFQLRAIIIFIILLFIIYIAGGSLRNQSTPSQSPTQLGQNLPTPIPANVELTTQVQNASVGEIVPVVISITSSEMGVEAADFYLLFDPDYIEVEDVLPGDFFRNFPIKKIGPDYVKISAVASFEENKIVIPKGTGTVATLLLKTIAETDSTAIRFDHVKTIVASNGKNILEKTNDLELTIQ